MLAINVIDRFAHWFGTFVWVAGQNLAIEVGNDPEWLGFVLDQRQLINDLLNGHGWNWGAGFWHGVLSSGFLWHGRKEQQPGSGS